MKFLTQTLAIMLLLLGATVTVHAQKKVKTRTVKVELQINASADRVWEAMVLDYGEISNFSPYIYSSNYENDSLKGIVGAERKCNFNQKGTQWAHEKIKSIDTENKTMINTPIDGAKLPLDFENSYATYSVKDNGDGTSTAGYEFIFRTKPALMGFFAKGGFKKQLLLFEMKIYYQEIHDDILTISKSSSE